MSLLESRSFFLLELFRGHEVIKNFSKFLQFFDSTLVCVSEAMRIEQKLRPIWEKPLIRVSEMEWRGIREARILLELAAIAVFDLLHEGFAPEEVASRRDMSWLCTRRIDCGSLSKKRWSTGEN
jgi:hypothetical protein